MNKINHKQSQTQGLVVHSYIFKNQLNQKTHMKKRKRKRRCTKIRWYICKTQTLVPNKHPPQQNKKKILKNVNFLSYQRTCKLDSFVESFFFYFFFLHLFFVLFKDFGLHRVLEVLGFTFIVGLLSFWVLHCCRVFGFLKNLNKYTK